MLSFLCAVWCWCCFSCNRENWNFIFLTLLLLHNRYWHQKLELKWRKRDNLRPKTTWDDHALPLGGMLPCLWGPCFSLVIGWRPPPLRRCQCPAPWIGLVNHHPSHMCQPLCLHNALMPFHCRPLNRANHLLPLSDAQNRCASICQPIIFYIFPSRIAPVPEMLERPKLWLCKIMQNALECCSILNRNPGNVVLAGTRVKQRKARAYGTRTDARRNLDTNCIVRYQCLKLRADTRHVFRTS